MKNLIRLVILALVLPFAASHELEIDVLALFKDAALLSIEGEQILLRAGQRSPQGILLVSATSKGAVIEISGKTLNLGLSSQIGTVFKVPESPSVSIMLNSAGQYKTSGSINGRPVTFLVDTGATIVAINSVIASSLGLNPERGRIMRATTASGVVESREVYIETIKVGGITARNVQAAVIQGNYPEEILLGMSFLRNVEIRESSGIMQLKAKY